MLSPNFTLEELTVSQTAARAGLDNTPPPVLVENGMRLCATLLEPIRHLLGDHSVIVSSGYRAPLVNAAVGGAPSSEHVVFCAADLTVPALPLLLVYQEIARAKDELPLDQLIWEYGAWVHAAVCRPGTKPRRELLMKPTGQGYAPFDLQAVLAASSR